jgi:aspartyl-tRNA(Asn)/glutamyl-tRNA(Gln) amidotransferase subunit A
MSQGALTSLTASQLLAAYRAGSLSPVEVVMASLDAAANTSSSLNAFALIDADAALADAEKSARRWDRGIPESPLDGVPIALKDSNLARGWPTRVGSRTTSPDPAPEDAPYVTRLRAAGAVLIGKTTTPEYCWKCGSDSPLTGVTRNPWDTAKTAGGSSGGSAVAVAASIVPIALGTDGGGSIRSPASLCGAVGFKPSFGAVPLHQEEGSSSFLVCGPLSRSVADAISAFEVLAGPHRPRADLRTDLKGLRIAYTLTMGYGSPPHEDVAAAVSDAVKILGRLGAEIESAAPEIAWPIDVYNTLSWAEQSRRLDPIAARHSRDMEPGLVEIIKQGKKISFDRYIEATEQRSQIALAMRSFHERYDLLVTPTLPVTAFPFGTIAPDSADVRLTNNWLPFSSIFNLTGQPALSIPCGFDRNGLPIGMQIVGPLGGDFEVLEVGRLFEVSASIPARSPPPSLR